jgi:hypothetical protein
MLPFPSVSQVYPFAVPPFTIAASISTDPQICRNTKNPSMISSCVVFTSGQFYCQYLPNMISISNACLPASKACMLVFISIYNIVNTFFAGLPCLAEPYVYPSMACSSSAICSITCAKYVLPQALSIKPPSCPLQQQCFFKPAEAPELHL